MKASATNWKLPVNAPMIKRLKSLATRPKLPEWMSSDSWRVQRIDPSGKRLRKLLKFHMDTEVFQLIDSPIPRSTYGKLMPLLDGRIAFWNYKAGIASNQRGIWVLNDEGNYWTKLTINIDLPVGIPWMYGFWMHAMVFAKRKSGSDEDQVKLYDVEIRKFINDLEIDPDCFCTYYYAYEESLLSLGSCKYIDS
ncbi:F-box associated ubiquitination effector family protein [Corchorus olitorius]|uniref:F-box associated ubiquitination effector family protein n=1 Tax=Corchorus olitorius TaxID=93759 RepID=A0A1R3IEW5_9ROSI|nr:F-box associated ubiquitination effector family protein [Corchorus olitorius]